MIIAFHTLRSLAFMACVAWCFPTLAGGAAASGTNVMRDAVPGDIQGSSFSGIRDPSFVGDQRVTPLIGGRRAEKGQFPWQVALLSAKTEDNVGAYLCGGSLIHPQWVLTAAHCVATLVHLHNLQVVVGEISLDKEGIRRIGVKKVVRHPDFKFCHPSDNDVALLLLEAPVSGRNILSISLVSDKEMEAIEAGLRTELAISGWGKTETGSVADHLQWAKVAYIDRDICSAPEIRGDKVVDNMICAGDLSGEVDACQGDSGGPLVLLSPSPDDQLRPSRSGWLSFLSRSPRAKSAGKLVGVVSWGSQECGTENKPGVYVRISNYISWIAEEIRRTGGVGEYEPMNQSDLMCQ